MLLGRYDTAGRLPSVGRNTTLAQAAGAGLTGLLTAAAPEHPWTGWSLSAGWGSRESLHMTWSSPNWSSRSAST
ncbi:hypothetical protein [Streptomyces griseosporeus]|uniref:hypothetical protein n=1 Tax=Streptomyces griseosporeus TaxID=1910 RepID=UPI0036FC555F